MPETNQLSEKELLQMKVARLREQHEESLRNIARNPNDVGEKDRAERLNAELKQAETELAQYDSHGKQDPLMASFASLKNADAGRKEPDPLKDAIENLKKADIEQRKK